MRLGSQGPDPFFYYNFWPWIKNQQVHYIGAALHTDQSGRFLLDMIKAARSSGSEIKAFVVGFITHYVLDRNAHPYIQYRAGSEPGSYQRLVTEIDTVMMEKNHKLKTWKTPVYKEIDIGRKLDPNITDLLYRLINKHYPHVSKDNNAYIKKAYRDMLLALRILADPTGLKNKLFRGTLFAYSHQPIKYPSDCLNEKKTTWYHPSTNEPSNKSFLELYSDSRVEGIEIITEVLNYWRNGSIYSLDKLKELLKNVSLELNDHVIGSSRLAT
jgi:hypothetical protein